LIILHKFILAGAVAHYAAASASRIYFIITSKTVLVGG